MPPRAAPSGADGTSAARGPPALAAGYARVPLAPVVSVNDAELSSSSPAPAPAAGSYAGIVAREVLGSGSHAAASASAGTVTPGGSGGASSEWRSWIESMQWEQSFKMELLSSDQEQLEMSAAESGAALTALATSLRGPAASSEDDERRRQVEEVTRQTADACEQSRYNWDVLKAVPLTLATLQVEVKALEDVLDNMATAPQQPRRIPVPPAPTPTTPVRSGTPPRVRGRALS
eukprot:TRINITY_DN23257_c0_g1_i3.p1 TRINITY_DN23257_c0_g1~~TRINITY_DN23257_c0_g1_i3.p1  ORF type:complete len:233 (-),score=62.68 TRINITY_DN23257_c0_g1_i3:38-736(-)